MSARRRGRTTRARTVAIALSIAAHGGIAVGLLMGVRAPLEPPHTPATDVQLSRIPTIAARPAIGGNQPPKADQRKRLTETRDTSRRSEASTAPEAPAPPVPSGEIARAERPQPGPGAAVRTGLECSHPDFLHLSADERRRCGERMLAHGGDIADLADAGVDPRKRAAFDAGAAREKWIHSPFLSAMPKKGCRPRVTEHDAAAFGKSEPDFTAQVTCVVGF